MPNSYLTYTGDGSTTKFALTGIDGWLNDGFIEVYLNGTLQNTGYSLIVESGVDKVQFTSAPASATAILLKRDTPNTIASFKSDIVDFNDGSVLTASTLERAVEALVHISQESEDQTGTAMTLTTDLSAWNAVNKRITNLPAGLNSSDAVNMEQFTAATLYGGAWAQPQAWTITGNGTVGPYTLTPAAGSTVSAMFIVEHNGVILAPDTYTVTENNITFTTGKSGTISIRNFGVARSVAVSTTLVPDNSVSTNKIQDDAVSFAKMQELSANVVMGRGSTSGNPEEIPCTAQARSLIAGANAAAMRSTLDLGAVSTLNLITSAYLGASSVASDKIAAGAVTTAKLASASVDSTKTTLNGPKWDNAKMYVGGWALPDAGGQQPYVNIYHTGRVEVQTSSASGSTNVWTTYNPSAAAATTIRADGVPTATTDLTTKAYVDAKPFFNLNPQQITGTNSSADLFNIEFDLNSVDGKRLITASQTFNSGKGTGNHYIRLKNGSASSMKIMLLWTDFSWEAVGGSGATATLAPLSMSVLPWLYNVTPFSQAMYTLSAGTYVYFRGMGTGWGNNFDQECDTTNSVTILGPGTATGTRCICKFWLLRLD